MNYLNVKKKHQHLIRLRENFILTNGMEEKHIKKTDKFVFTCPPLVLANGLQLL